MNTLRYALSPLGGALLRAGLIVLSLAAILAAATPIHATTTANIIYVIPGGTGGGTSWTDGKDLAPALSGAASGSQLWVKAGTYKPTTTSDRTATFALKSGVAIYGGLAGTETQLSQRNANPATNNTVLSGDIGTPNDNGDNSYHVVTGSGTASTAVLDGFTISGGNASGDGMDSNGGGMYNDGGSPTLTNVTFSGNSGSGQWGGDGGGMHNKGGSPTLTNVTFSGNSAWYGGGMDNKGGSPTLTNVTFSGNSVNGEYGGEGGGMDNWDSSPTLTNVIFSGNSAYGEYGEGGGMKNWYGSPTLTNVTFGGNSASHDGGGMDNYGGSPTLTNVTFSGNSASDSGGGMFNGNGSPTLTNVTFSGNSASGQYSSGYSSGGGMYNWDSSPTLTNVTFSGNSAYEGGGMYNDGNSSSPTLTNVTFSGNSASHDGGGMYNYGGSPTIRDSILWGDSGGEIVNDNGGSASVTYSIVQGSSATNWWSTHSITDGGHNLDADPLFVTPVTLPPPANTSGNLRLGPGSPAIDVGDNNVANPSLPSTDLDGNPRIIGPKVDMGAYEFLCPPGAPPTLYVNASVSGGTGVGDSWANASPTLSFALARALACPTPIVTQVWVAKGTYTPSTTGDRNATFSLKNNVALYGGFTSGQTSLSQRNANPATNNTVLSGDLNGDDGPNFANNGENSYHVVTGSGTDATAILDGFTITGGNATNTASHFICPANCGGAMYSDAGSPTLTNVTFSGNSAYLRGGGMANERGSNPTLTNVVLEGNTNTSGEGGGGMSNSSSSPTLTNVVFSGNSAANGYGAGMINYSSNPTLTNVTFSGNAAKDGAGAMYNLGSNPKIRNSILWGDTAKEIHGYGSTPVVSNSIVQGSGGSANWNSNFGTDGGGNLDADPKFITPITARAPTTTGNLRLQTGSPAFNKGNNAVTDPSLPATDLDGNPRIMFGIVDMGAYEIQYSVSFVSPLVGPPSVNSLYPTSIGTTATPVKWTLKNGAGQAVTAAGTVTAVAYKANPGCATPFPTDPTGATAASITSSNPKYDVMQKLWVYNWVLPGRGCYTLFITLNGGQVVPLFYHIY
ncbi:MAG: choice-of-anchor Q domain-containing protein [Anaerolineae bacterium]